MDKYAGQLIAEGREGEKISQSGLGKKANLSSGTIARWETGDLPISKDAAERVADLLKIDKDMLIKMVFLESLQRSLTRQLDKFKMEYEDYPSICEKIDELREYLNKFIETLSV